MTLIERAREIREREKRALEDARLRIPSQFHSFIIYTPRTEVLAKKRLELNKELIALGAYATDTGTFLRYNLPYLTVMGQLAWLRSESFDTTLTVDWKTIDGKLCAVAEFKGRTPDGFECHRMATSQVVVTEKGSRSVNPMEMAETSAIGRVLRFAGYGLIGAGVLPEEEQSTEIKLNQVLDQEQEQKVEGAEEIKGTEKPVESDLPQDDPEVKLRALVENVVRTGEMNVDIEYAYTKTKEYILNVTKKQTFKDIPDVLCRRILDNRDFFMQKVFIPAVTP